MREFQCRGLCHAHGVCKLSEDELVRSGLRPSSYEGGVTIDIEFSATRRSESVEEENLVTLLQRHDCRVAGCEIYFNPVFNRWTCRHGFPYPPARRTTYMRTRKGPILNYKRGRKDGDIVVRHSFLSGVFQGHSCCKCTSGASSLEYCLKYCLKHTMRYLDECDARAGKCDRDATGH